MRRTGVVDVDGTRLTWVRDGPVDPALPSVVLAHGLTDAAACWGEVATRLARTYDVVAYDARGHGASDRASGYGFAEHVGDLVGLVRGLELERPVLVGHSMGGCHATVAAPLLEARALVLEDPHWPAHPEDATSHDVGAGRRDIARVAATDEDQRRAEARARHPGWSEQDVAAWARAWGELDPDVVGWFGSWSMINRWRDHVSALRCPTLLVTGDRSPTVTRASAAQARRRCPQLRIREIRGAGHDVRRDRLEAYWRALVDFLDRL